MGRSVLGVVEGATMLSAVVSFGMFDAHHAGAAADGGGRIDAVLQRYAGMHGYAFPSA